MDLLVIRHAIAGDREEWAQTGRPDHERPITDEGRERMRENARGMRRLMPRLDLLATSPFVRAVETAEVVAEAYDDIGIMDAPVLACGKSPAEVCAWLATRPEARIAVVGHEPDLGHLVSWLVFGGPSAGIALKKGGASLLRFDGAPARAAAELKWLLPPKVLRQVAS